MSIPMISKLAHDVLFRIFSLNADLFDGKDQRIPHESPRRALTTTRYTSQVCREWRRILLGSASLWAKLMDLDLLQQVQGDWRTEILRRSGKTAPLWIRNTRIAMVAGMRVGVEDFLLLLLDEYWDRVEILEIFVKDWARLSAKCDQLCLRPAPSLRTFVVEMSKYQGKSVTLPSVPVLRLFGNEAPLIHEICAPRMPLDMCASWLSHLRKLTMFIQHDLALLFKALSSMHLLEVIDIVTAEGSSVDFQNEVPFSYGSPIHLPRLDLLAIKDSLRTCLAFVEYIIPSPGCSLHLAATYWASAPLTPHLLPCIEKPISRYFTSYFEVHNPVTEFELWFADEGATMRLMNFSGPNGICFFFSITREDGLLDGEEILRYLLSPFTPLASPCHITIKRLVLQLRPLLPSRGLSPIFGFLSCFSSVEEMTTDDSTLSIYMQSRNIGLPILFPRLQSLALAAVSSESIYNLGFDVGLFAFLAERQRAGVKVRTLDITSWRNVTAENLEKLLKGDLKDLVTEVKWMQNGEVVEHCF